MAGTSWSREANSNLPKVTITLDSPVYGGLEGVTGIVGRPDYQGTFVDIVWMSEGNANIGMQDVLNRLKDAGAIHGHLYDSQTGVSVG
jgi:hypothetical protein